MSTPNPLVPEGSLQPAKGKSNVKIAVLTIAGIHAVLLVGLLMQGCKDKPKVAAIEPENTATNDTAAYGNMTVPVDPTAVTPAVSTPLATVTPVSTTPIAGTTPAITPSVTPTSTPLTTTTPYSDPVVASGSATEHAIASGETLGKIAKDNHVTLKALLEANPNVNPTKLQIGQKIQVPAATATATAKADAPAAALDGAANDSLYVVKPGDVLERIAKNHGTSVKALKMANNLKTDRLKVGQKLKLPAAKATATADVAPVAPESPLATTTLTPSATMASAHK
ncbi:MAG: peptidoglycan-binding protein [Verrucomicrobiales bacterium]|nr:peptidoglycan-binding protein [Verrucomicrobiales bacterium]